MKVVIAGGKNMERHNLAEKIIRIFSVPLLNHLPQSTVQGMMRSSSKDAKTVTHHGGSTIALEAMYTRFHRGLFSRGFWHGIADYFWHHCISQPRALRNRLKLVEENIENEIRRLVRSGIGRINIVNLGGGSSRALIHTVSKLKKEGLQFKVMITNIDRDSKAIELGKKIAGDFGMEDSFRWINDDARSIKTIAQPESVDIIEMVGLLDYFNHEKAVSLTESIYETLKEDGLFIVANVFPNREMRFVRNTGWPKMYYRQPEDMEKILEEGGFEHEPIIIKEPLKVHIIALVEK